MSITMNKVSKKDTTVVNENGVISVVYQDWRVVFVKDGLITLRRDRWHIPAMKTRMNQAANEFGLNYQVVKIGGDWFIERNGKRILFTEGSVTFPKNGSI